MAVRTKTNWETIGSFQINCALQYPFRRTPKETYILHGNLTLQKYLFQNCNKYDAQAKLWL